MWHVFGALSEKCMRIARDPCITWHGMYRAEWRKAVLAHRGREGVELGVERVRGRGVGAPARQLRRPARLVGEQVGRAHRPPGVERPLVPGEVVGEPAGGDAPEPREPVPEGGARGARPVERRPVRGRVPLVARPGAEGGRPTGWSRSPASTQPLLTPQGTGRRAGRPPCPSRAPPPRPWCV